MSIHSRITQGSSSSAWGEASVVSVAEFTIETEATAETTIGSWRIELGDCAGDSDYQDPIPTQASPLVVASGNGASPSWTHTPAAPASYLLRITTWESADQAGASEVEYREFRAGYANYADAEPCVVSYSVWREAIDAQAAAGRGRHDNFGGAIRGWPSRLSLLFDAISTLTAELAEARAQADAAYALADGVREDFDAVATSEILPFSATIDCSQTGIMEYSGADTSLVFTAGDPPFATGAMVTVVIPAGAVTGSNTVTCDGTISQPSDWPAIDITTDFVLRFFAESPGSLAVSASQETRPVVDIVAPTITAVSVADANPNRLVVTTSEPTTWTDATGFALSGYTLGAVTGSGTTHYIAVTPQVPAGTSLGNLTWDATNTVVDSVELPLAAGSRAVTNSVVAPTIASANIVGSTLTINLSEACTCGGITGLSLSGTSETITSLTSGSGTAALVFALSGSVTSGTVTLNATGSNQIADAGGTALAAVSGVEVTFAAAPQIASASINGDSLTVVYDMAVSHSNTTNWTATIAGVGATVTYASGTGTTTLVYTTSTAAEEGDVVTLSATAPTGHAATATGVALAAFGVSVTNSTSSAPTILWEDDFERAPGAIGGTWQTSLGSAALVIANDAGQGCAYEDGIVYGYHVWQSTPSGVTLPASYRVTATIRHADRNISYWGLVIKWSGGQGIRLLRETGDNLALGNANGFNSDNVSVTVTGGVPASWSVDQDHTVSLAYDATSARCTIYLDGAEYGYGTITVNQATTGTGVGFCGEAQHRYKRSIVVEAL